MRVPMVDGQSTTGGGSYSPALTDFVVMTKQGNMFLTGPAVVRDVMERLNCKNEPSPKLKNPAVGPVD